MEAFLNISTICVTTTDTKKILSTLGFLQSLRKLWKSFMSKEFTTDLIDHVHSKSYNVFSFQLGNKKKTTQQWSFCVTNEIVVKQVSAYFEKVYADIVVSRFWFARSFSLKQHSECDAHIPPKAERWVPSVYPYWRLQDQIPFMQGKRHFSAFLKTLNEIKLSKLLCLSWMRTFLNSRESVVEG